MKDIEKYYLIFLILILASTRAIADDRTECYITPKYVVVEGTTGEVGTNFLIKYKSNPSDNISCDYNPEEGDLEIKNEFAEYFLDLQGDLLILDSGTGPDPRGLIIWNLKKRSKVYEGTYSEPYEIKPGYMEFWTETGKATDENCPSKKKWDADGLGAAIETKVKLNFPDLSLIKSSQTRCSPRQ